MRVFRPWAFQGSLRRRNYFEGWYFKHVSADRKQVWSFIPGISLTRENSHAFIQALNGRTGDSYVFEYGLETFSASSRELALRLGTSAFTTGGIRLDAYQTISLCEGEDQVTLAKDRVCLPTSFFSDETDRYPFFTTRLRGQVDHQFGLHCWLGPCQIFSKK